jgi:hypothetical protein
MGKKITIKQVIDFLNTLDPNEFQSENELREFLDLINKNMILALEERLSDLARIEIQQRRLQAIERQKELDRKYGKKSEQLAYQNNL